MKQKVNYEEIKKAALKTPLMEQKVSLSNIRIDGNNQIIVNSQPIATTADAVQDLYRFIGVNPGFVKRFGELTDKKSREDLIEIVKTAIVATSKKKSTITLIANPEMEMVTRILPGNRDVIPNEIALKMFEQIMNNKDLAIAEGSYDTTEGLKFSVRREKVFEEIVGEAYNPGFAFSNSLEGGISLKNYVERLVCQNGLTVEDEELVANVRRLTGVKLEDFFRTFSAMEQKDFASKTFTDKLIVAMETKASFYELSKMKNIMVNNSIIKPTEISKFLPEWDSEVNRLARAGVDYVNCTDRQLQNHATKHSVWDVINRGTDFGSHDYGHGARNTIIQTKIGDLFLKPEYDLAGRLNIEN